MKMANAQVSIYQPKALSSVISITAREFSDMKSDFH